MWPTEQTIWLLLLGLIPIAWLGILVARYGSTEVTSLRFTVIVLIWIGYHLSPILSYVNGQPWKSFLLVPYYLDDALLFSAIGMFAILFGYRLVVSKSDLVLRNASAKSRWTLPIIKWQWVFVLSFLVLMLTVYNVGGVEDFWDASYYRGQGQWSVHSLGVIIARTLNVILTPLVVILITISSIHIIQNPYSLGRLLIGSLGIMIGMLPALHHFSRMAGFGLFILAYLILIFSRNSWKSKLMIVLLVLVGYHLGAVGLSQRGNFNPGIGNFMTALLIEDNSKENDRPDSWFAPEKNPLDSVASFTRRVEVKYVLHHLDPIEFIPVFLRNINPVPSGLLNPGMIGLGLSEFMGTVGSVGLTSPAMADVFYAFSYYGLVIMVILGILYGYIDRYSIHNPGLAGKLAVLLAVISAGIGLHNGIRAQTRPMLYAFIIIWVASTAVSHIKSRRSG